MKASGPLAASWHNQRPSCLSRCNRFWNCEPYWIRCSLPVTVGLHPGRFPIQTRRRLREEKYLQALEHECSCSIRSARLLAKNLLAALSATARRTSPSTQNRNGHVLIVQIHSEVVQNVEGS